MESKESSNKEEIKEKQGKNWEIRQQKKRKEGKKAVDVYFARMDLTKGVLCGAGLKIINVEYSLFEFDCLEGVESTSCFLKLEALCDNYVIK